MSTAAEISAEITAYKAAISAIVAGDQEYSIKGQIFKKADLATLQRHVNFLQQQLNSENTGGRMVQTKVVFAPTGR